MEYKLGDFIFSKYIVEIDGLRIRDLHSIVVYGVEPKSNISDFVDINYLCIRPKFVERRREKSALNYHIEIVLEYGDETR